MEHAINPGSLIREAMESRGWSQRDLAIILGRPLPAINEVIKGRRAISPEMAVSLAAAFGIDAARLLHMEADYRLSQLGPHGTEIERRAKLFEIAPIKYLEKRGWIRKVDTAEELEVELRRFFGVQSLDQPPDVAASFRRTTSDENTSPAQRAWYFRAKQLAQSIEVGPFSDEAFDKGIGKLRRLTGWPEEARRVPRILARMGIRFVVIEPLPHTKIDGVAFWLDSSSPVIALSIRYDRVDSFWHTLGHELSHVKNRDEPVLDTDIVGEARPFLAAQNATERRADSDAAAMWLDTAELMSFIRRVGPFYSRARINQFANRLTVHPGLIVGALQFRGELTYKSLRDTLVKIRAAAISEAVADGWGHVVGT